MRVRKLIDAPERSPTVFSGYSYLPSRDCKERSSRTCAITHGALFIDVLYRQHVPWPERPFFDTIRYVPPAGIERNADIEAYIGEIEQLEESQ